MVLILNRVPSSQPMSPTPSSKHQHQTWDYYRSPKSKPIITSFIITITHDSWNTVCIITKTQQHKQYHIEPHNFMYNMNMIVSHWNHTSQPTCHQNRTIKYPAIILAIYHINLSTTKTEYFAKRFNTSSWKPQQQYTHNLV